MTGSAAMMNNANGPNGGMMGPGVMMDMGMMNPMAMGMNGDMAMMQGMMPESGAQVQAGSIANGNQEQAMMQDGFSNPGMMNMAMSGDYGMQVGYLQPNYPSFS